MVENRKKRKKGAANKMTYNLGDWKYGILVKKRYTQSYVNLWYILLPWTVKLVKILQR